MGDNYAYQQICFDYSENQKNINVKPVCNDHFIIRFIKCD